MANETTKCPMCGTKLKMTDGKLTCKKCGYYVRSQNEQTDAQNSGSYASSQPDYTSSQSNYSASGQSTAGQQSSSGQGNFGATGTKRHNGETNSTVAVITAVILGAVCVASIVAIVLFRSGAFDKILPGNDPQNSTANRHSNSQSQTSGQSQDSGQSQASQNAAVRLPQSDFFCSVSEAIWGKDYSTITADEYASLTALEINRDEKTIYYQLDGGEWQSLTYLRSISMDLADLASFTGLEYIAIDDDLDVGDLKGLDRLLSVYVENTIDELARIIPHPENIVGLGVKDSIFKKSLDGLENFPSLLYLEVDYDSLEDISALEQFPDLLSLSLTDCDKLMDYSPLMSLTELEYLSIESSQLKTIDFIRQMPYLTTLIISDSQIPNLSALESCPGLTQLSLMNNTSVEDFSIISQLDQLSYLELEVNYNGDMPSLANLSQLEQLSLKYVGDLSPLRDATGLTYLSLERCAGRGLDALASLENLTVLKIHDFSSYTESLEPLAHLPNLVMLSMEDTHVFGNVEEIFGIPNLEYLYLDNCQIGLDFDQLPTNESLMILSLNSTTILRDPSYNNGDKVTLSEHYDMFSHFPNLTELYLTSLNLDSIDFVEDLPMLQYLDITNNNVTSLKPLEALPDFRAVWCGKNTILENVSEDSYINVITDN